MKNPSSTLDLKIFGWIGFLALCASVVVIPVIIAFFIASGGPSSSILPEGLLGGQGGICGGPQRLPCNAGLTCVHDVNVNADLGTCEPAPEAATSTVSVPSDKGTGLVGVGQACGAVEQICEPTLVCAKSGSCAESATSSPRILSVKIEGAQLNDGVYRVIAGSKTLVTVQAVNTKEVSVAVGKTAIAMKLKQGKGGVYTGEVTFLDTESGEFILKATGTDASVSGLVMKVATVQAVR